MHPFIQKHLQTPSGTVSYWTTDTPNKPSVFLMHGAGMDHYMFEAQYPVLQDANIITWDARGHGKSVSIKGSFTLTDLANDALEILKSLGIREAVFIGQSAGSMVAQEVYRLNPSVVKGLVSIGGSPIMLTYSKMDIWLLNLSSTIIRFWPYKNFLKAFAKTTSVKAEVQAYASKTVSTVSKQEFMGIWDVVTRSLSVSGIEGMHLPVPLLITYGDHDTTGTVKNNNKRWKEYEKDARLVVIPDAGHNANQDNPEFFNILLNEYLTTNGYLSSSIYLPSGATIVS
jgi:3-oxoadipate enol-lactonase